MCGTEVIGSRVYVTGNSYPLKDKLKAAGCHWDPDRRMWWIGKAKAAAVNAIIDTGSTGGSNDAPVAKPAEDPNSIRIVGKCKYKGKTYYARYFGPTKRGYSARLVTLDGKLDFWAGAAEPGDRSHDGSGDVAVMVKAYSPREYRGRT